MMFVLVMALLIMLLMIEYAFIIMLLMRTVFKKMRKLKRVKFEITRSGVNAEIEEADYIKEKREN